ncbi:class I glutamine amidotransferase-like protein [Hypoxylon trugodes]|uniref:class I glutamine amidotransferase-like protein n=1 Tax=Hypoxylon trugodes TaxID=326681 RepID=UPI002195EE59|nr:class I glutamine amidotransferase-like protein [Hypoxylon trugodes]KAI1386082.1 class I glutamine amidotransferase-like protein [Hypoxylon trugodes]
MGSEYIPPIRLAILEADTPVPGIQSKFGSYGGVFEYLFARGCKSFKPPVPLSAVLKLSYHDVVHDPTSYPDLNTIDAILISGSKHNAFDQDPWILELVKYTRKCLDSGRVRVIGVCFGHQIVGLAMGTPVGTNLRGWELSVVEHNLTEEGKKFFGLEKLSIHQMHRDIVHKLPPGVIALASTDICPVQAMYAPRRLITVQGHPEFTKDMVGEILQRRYDGGILSPDIYKDGMRRVGNEHDGVAVARAFIRFLRE